jgi:hypothetical protein
LAQGETDWAKVDRMSEAELAAVVAADRDDPGNDPEFWDRARLVFPNKKRVTLRLDAACPLHRAHAPRFRQSQ